jgi:cytochrome c-type biogenesis protein CcmH
MKALRSFRLWCVAAIVVVGWALFVPATTSSAASRVAHLESLVRCPSCEDLSVAQSTSTSSLAVRREIESDVQRGWSDNRILTSIEDAYGTSILLSPSLGGIGSLLWLAPWLVGVLVLVSFWRIRRRS